MSKGRHIHKGGKVKGNRCTVTWNPGTWPYTTRCVNTRGHRGATHDDGKGHSIPNLGPAQEDQ